MLVTGMVRACGTLGQVNWIGEWLVPPNQWFTSSQIYPFWLTSDFEMSCIHIRTSTPMTISSYNDCPLPTSVIQHSKEHLQIGHIINFLWRFSDVFSLISKYIYVLFVIDHSNISQISSKTDLEGLISINNALWTPLNIKTLRSPLNKCSRWACGRV